MPYVVGYFAVLLGLLLVQAVFLAFAIPVTGLIFLLWALLGDVGIGLGAVLVSPAWIWLAVRFFFPSVLQMIWIDGRPALFALHRVTPERMIGVVMAQLAVLRSDLATFSVRIERWLNA